MTEPEKSASPRAPRVLNVGSHPDQKQPGGVITHMRILRSLRALGDVDVFDVGSLHGSAALRGRFALGTILMNLFRLRKKVRAGNYDVIMLHQPITSGALVKLCLELSVLPGMAAHRALVFFHGGRFENLPMLRNGLIRLIFRRVLARARRFYFLSRVELSGFQRWFGGLPHAYFRNFSGSDALLDHRSVPDDGLRLLYVGRIVRVKGVFDIVDAVRRLAPSLGDRLRVTFVGDGPDMQALRARTMGLEGVRFTGYLDGIELENEYASADVFLLPTAHPEGFPYVVIEAMRAGLPIISTSEGALEALVRNGENGYRVPFGDVDALASAITLLSDPALRHKMGRANQDVFRNDLSLQGAERFYADLLEREFGL